MKKSYSSKFKSKVALEAIQGESTIAEIAGKYQVHVNQVQQWKKRLMDGADGIFATAAERRKKDHKCRYFVYMDETLRHMEATGRMNGKIGNETAEELKEIQSAQLLFGTFALKSTLLSTDAEETYRIYKTREDIEQLFDIYKDEEDFKTTGMHSKETMEATFFLNHLSTMLLYKLYEKLQEKKALSQYAASKVCDVLWDVRASNMGARWQLEPIPKMSRKLITAMGLQPPKEVR